MRITSVQVYEYRVEYADGPLTMSGGRTATGQPSFVVRVGTDEGIEGWGETCPNGATYNQSFFAGERAAVPLLAEAVLGLDPCRLSHVNARMDDEMLGAPAAKSALDIACWDILGKAAGVPVATLLGGVTQETIALARWLPVAAPAAMAARAADYRRAGVTHLQMKVGDDWRTDVERVRAVIEAAGPDVSLVVDANGGWNLQSALLAVRQLDGLPVHLEQPCRTLADCALLRAHTALPMIADESINTLADLAAAKRAGIAGVNLKPQRVGGLTRARLLRDAAQALDMSIEIDDTFGGTLATAHVAQLAASTDSRNFMVAAFSSDWTTPAISNAPIVSQGGGSAEALRGAGLGVEVDAAALGASTYASSAGRVPAGAAGG
jgi:L-alanine-DL-glutamate epimerase-like enolase superfamily enzyme